MYVDQMVSFIINRLLTIFCLGPPPSSKTNSMASPILQAAPSFDSTLERVHINMSRENESVFYFTGRH